MAQCSLCRHVDAAGLPMARLAAWTPPSTRARCSPRSMLTAPTTPFECAAFTSGCQLPSSLPSWARMHVSILARWCSRADAAGVQIAGVTAGTMATFADKARGQIRLSRPHWAVLPFRGASSPLETPCLPATPRLTHTLCTRLGTYVTISSPAPGARYCQYRTCTNT